MSKGIKLWIDRNGVAYLPIEGNVTHTAYTPTEIEESLKARDRKVLEDAITWFNGLSITTVTQDDIDNFLVKFENSNKGL